jgi:hypothetical protein
VAAALARWDAAALRGGVGVAAVFAAPFAVLGRLALSEDWSDTIVIACNLAMIGGLFLGAGVTAWRQRVGTPLSHGIVVALLAYVLIQIALVVARLVRGADVDVAAIVFNTAFALGAGLLGGLVGQLLLSRGLVPPERPSSSP